MEKQTISSSFHPVRLFTVSSEVVLKEMALNFDEFTASRQRAKSREAEDKPMNTKGHHCWVGKFLHLNGRGGITCNKFQRKGLFVQRRAFLIFDRGVCCFFQHKNHIIFSPFCYSFPFD